MWVLNIFGQAKLENTVVADDSEAVHRWRWRVEGGGAALSETESSWYYIPPARSCLYVGIAGW